MKLIAISLLSLLLLSPSAFAQTSQAKRVQSESSENLAVSDADLLAAQRHTAVSLAAHGDLRAREFADKIYDSDRKSQVRQFIDFQFLQLAIKKKEVSEVIRLAETGQLTPTQRAFAYTQAARLVMGSERERSLELLEKATHQTTRIESASVDRAVLLVGIAIQLTTTEPSRVWEVMSQAAKAANASEDFNGENSIGFWMPTRGSLKTITIGGENYSLFRLFQLLAKEDLYRWIDLTKSFKNDAPRAASILGVASAVLSENKTKAANFSRTTHSVT